MHEEMGDESIKSEIYHLTSGSKGVIHLFRINPESISSIYFGCNSSESKAVELIKANHSLTGLRRIYKMRINRTQYQLEPVNLSLEDYAGSRGGA
jgi:hypothetical protein